MRRHANQWCVCCQYTLSVPIHGMLGTSGDCPNVTTDGSGSGENTSVGPIDVTVREGGSAVFSCNSSGTIHWLIDCQSSLLVGNTSVSNTSAGSVLTLVAMRGLNGARIMCVVDGVLVGSANLSVLCEWKHSPVRSMLTPSSLL